VKQHPDALLLIAGKGPMREKLAARIQSMDLDDHVRLLGFVPDDDLPYAYRAANFSVVPTTEHEGFGLITIESMAAGTPVLVTPVGGLPETVRALSDALVLPSASPQAVQDGLTAALDGTLSLPNSEACKAHVRARFDWPVIAQQVRRVYEEVL
jgi:glycosyltransferase involved in cell wall biosynthesis